MASTPLGSPDVDSTAPSHKTRSLAARACDACRARRRKCTFDQTNVPDDDAPSQCTGCARLAIQCSFQIPTRPRGPKRKRHTSSASPVARSVSRSSFRQETVGSETPESRGPAIPQPSPSPFATHQGDPRLCSTFALQPNSARLHSGPFPEPRHAFPTDELCSRPLLRTIMLDYMDLVYPLVPVVHIPTFRRNLDANRDTADVDFLSHILGLVALTVSLLPSHFAAYKAADPGGAARFPNRVTMVSYCAQMCLRLRSPEYWDEVSHCKWAISYTLAIAYFQVGQKNHNRMLEAEAMQLARLLGVHRISAYEGLNPIETQLRKKAFWLTFYIFTHSKVQPGRQSHITYLDNYMLQDIDFDALEPDDILDEYIYETASPNPQVAGASDRQFTHVSAFIVASRIFHKVLNYATSNDRCDCGNGRSREERLSRLQGMLHDFRYTLDYLPAHMGQWAVSENYYHASQESPATGASPPMISVRRDAYRPEENAGSSTRPSEADITHAQFEVSRANIHVSHLWFQSFLLDKMDEIIQEPEGMVGQDASRASVLALLEASWREREHVCRQLLHVVHNIQQVHLEPNGNVLTYKIRAVATSLLNCPFTLDAHMAQRATGYVREFIKVLSYLDHSELVNTDSLETWVDRDRVGLST